MKTLKQFILEAMQTEPPLDSKIYVTNTGGKIKVEMQGSVKGSLEAVEMPNQSGVKAYIIESAVATSGYGPLLYDIMIEEITINGGCAISDRKNVSDDAFKIWNYYYFKRPDVAKVELPMGMWYGGNRAEKYFDTINDDKLTWPPKNDPIWSLWTGYKKSLILIPKLESEGKLIKNLNSSLTSK